MSSKGSQAPRVARAAARYRPGKAPVNAGEPYSSEEGSSSGEEERRSESHAQPVPNQRRTAGVVIHTGEGPIQGRPVQVKLQDVRIGQSQPASAEGEQSSEYETDTDDQASPPIPVFRPPGAAKSAFPPKASSSEYETDSEEESSEDDRPQMLKPIFVPKNQRVQAKDEPSRQQVDEEEAERKAQQEAEVRRKQSHLLAAERIKQELAEREHDDTKPDLSDTDDKDPEAEFSAWRIRELSRIKRERETAAERDAEKAEIERRRAMPEAERLAEDTERAERSRQEKKKGDQGFLQKYYHKGSFFQDLDILKKRDYTAMTESSVDKKALPTVMQVRDYGKKSRSKWTHLANEDTSRKQGDPRFKGISGTSKGIDAGAAGQGCFLCGGPHLRRDCPEQQSRESGPGRGANNVPVRNRGNRERDLQHHDDRDNRDRRHGPLHNDRWEDGSAHKAHQRSASRSRSPPKRRREVDSART